MESVFQRDRDLPTLGLRGEANYSKGTERWFFRFELIAERPDTFLFTILDPVGPPAYRIFSGPTEFKALDYRQRIFYRGEALEYPLEAFLPLPLTAADFLDLLSGRLPSEPVSARPESLDVGQAKFRTFVYQTQGRDPGPWRAQLSAGTAGFLPEDRPGLQQLSRGPRGNPDFLVRYEKWGSYPREDLGTNSQFPEVFRASWQGNPATQIRATYTEVRLGFTMPPGVFIMDQPEGFEMRIF
jgi:hypothetical protein